MGLRTLGNKCGISQPFQTVRRGFFFSSVCRSRRQALLLSNYNPCHRHEQKYISQKKKQKKNIFKLIIFRVSMGIENRADELQVHARQCNAWRWCADDIYFLCSRLHFSSRHFVVFFYLSPSFSFHLISNRPLHTSLKKNCLKPRRQSQGCWITFFF